MKKLWSKSWVSSKQPRKQRKYRYNAPLHTLRKYLAAHLSKDLRKKYGKRSLVVRKGDKVKIMRGKFKKQEGEVTKVDVRKGRIYIKGIAKKKIAGTEVQLPINPSKVMLIELNLEDSKRLSKEEKK